MVAGEHLLAGWKENSGTRVSEEICHFRYEHHKALALKRMQRSEVIVLLSECMLNSCPREKGQILFIVFTPYTWTALRTLHLQKEVWRAEEHKAHLTGLKSLTKGHHGLTGPQAQERKGTGCRQWLQWWLRLGLQGENGSDICSRCECVLKPQVWMGLGILFRAWRCPPRWNGVSSFAFVRLVSYWSLCLALCY